MGMVEGSHGYEWRDFIRCSGGLTHDGNERLMGAWLTWRGLPIPMHGMQRSRALCGTPS